MKIGLYQMVNAREISLNFSLMEKAIVEGKNKECDLIVFPECALTGYPPVEIKSIDVIDERTVSFFEEKIRCLAKDYKIFVIFGTIRFNQGKKYNSLKVIDDYGVEIDYYDKRALWGYDLENFEQGKKYTKVRIKQINIGLSICFEIRFPEYYRAHKKEHVDLMITSFCDVSEFENEPRYQLIKGHIQTRAVENVIPHLSVNSASMIQTAPTAAYNMYGFEVIASSRNTNELVVYEYEKPELSFGAKGIIEVSKKLI